MNEKYILGTKVNDVDLKTALKIFEDILNSDQNGGYITTPNAEICLLASKNEKLSQIIKKSNLSIPDGFGLKVGSLLQGKRIVNHIPGVDFCKELINYCHKHNKSVLLLGGLEISGSLAVTRLKQEFVGLNIKHLNPGLINKDGEIEDLEKIKNLNFDLVLVGLGSPKQEFFIDNYRGVMNSRLLIGCGGTIDFLAGIVKRAPKWVNKIGFEWFFRLFNRPKSNQAYRNGNVLRIFNAIIVFPLKSILWRLRTHFLFRPSVVGFIINNDGKILIAERAKLPGHWQLPQGGVEKHQTKPQAVLKEMEEELGLTDLTILDSKIDCYKYSFNYFISKPGYPYKGQKQSIFLLKLNSGTPKVDAEELRDCKWVSRDEILNIVHPFRANIVKLGLELYDKHFHD